MCSSDLFAFSSFTFFSASRRAFASAFLASSSLAFRAAKQCKAEGETAKVSIRNARRDGIDALKKAVKDGLAEDEQKNAEAKLQKVHDKYIAKIEEMLAEKDKEIMTV